MKCCGACFSDRFISEEIARLSVETGKCQYCKTEGVPIVDPNFLADKFELVIGIYEIDPEGNRLIDWLIEDWELFAIGRAEAMILLGDILDDAERVRQTYKPSDLCASDSLNVWEALRNELRTKNRFFPETNFNLYRLGDLLRYLSVPTKDIPQKWYRARVEESGEPFPPENMGAPPAKNSGPGRANPVGIPYLYVGSAPDTAVTEVRPHPGEVLTLAEFTIVANVRLIDLRNPRALVTPFVMEDIEQVAAMRGDIDYLERLGQELTTPVLSNAAAIDYIPSQFLCELIKRVGYDGVLYSSSVSKGMNLALFVPDNGSVGDVYRVKIDAVGVSYSNYFD